MWSFGHELDTVGRRNLLLQDAYVYRVIETRTRAPRTRRPYKLAASAHDVGTVSNDAPTAVVGRLAPPATSRCACT